jgi:esterase/lipase superfamily enzyme
MRRPKGATAREYRGTLIAARLEGTIAVSVRQPIASVVFFLLLTLFSVATRDVAGAQERWPPWQSYGEAESAARKKALRRPGRLETDASLDRQIAQLKAAGKYAEAVPLAQRALALAEKKGANSPAVATALDTLAGLYEAQNKYAEAEPLLKRSLAIREKSPGQPDVAASRERLAVAYDKMGRSTDAKTMRSARAPEPKNGEAEKKKQDEAAKAEAEAQRAAAQEAERKASEERAQAQEAAKDQPGAGRRYHARRDAPSPSDPAGGAAPPVTSPAPPSNEPADGAAAEDQLGSPAPEAGEDMRPMAPPPGTFGGAPPPSAEAPAPSAQPPPPAPVPPPSLEGGSGFGRARSATRPPPLGSAAPPPAAAAPAPPPPAKVTVAPSGGGAVAPASEEDWQTVPVYWGTDRAVQPNAQRLAFGSDRARKLQLGEALITVPKVHQVPNVERPWVVKIPYFDVTIYAEKEDPKSHFTVKEIKALTKEELLAQVKARLGASKLFKDQAVVFVHGYNTSFDNALYRTAQIAYDLDFDGATFLYSWPSGGAVASYTYDRESAQASEPYLREFLEMVVKQTGAKQVSIIAHSMGNQPLMDVLRDMRSSAPEGVEISQVILAAPDVDADSFTNLARTIKGLAKNVTLYVASNDRALIVSRNFWGSYRAGDVPPAGPLILEGIDTIDVTAASTDTFAINHSGYASNNKLLEDIGELLKTGLRPPEMRILKPGKISGPTGDYWRYVPAPP